MKHSYKGCNISIHPFIEDGELIIYGYVVTVHSEKHTQDHQFNGELKADNQESAKAHILNRAKSWIDSNVQ
jgi:hypothetical protein